MGLSNSSVGKNARKAPPSTARLRYTVALAGNPNVGKSSVFNALTGLNNHTGNWTGKTVECSSGDCIRENMTFIDLPGTYSLSSGSPEELIARDYIRSGKADVTVVVCDALCLERNLSLALQILEITNRAVVCVNLMDEAKKRGVSVDTKRLSELLGVPVAATSARTKKGLDTLCDTIRQAAENDSTAAPALTYSPEAEEELSSLAEKGHSRADIVKQWLSGDEMSDDVKAAWNRLSGNDPGRFRNMLTTRPIICAEAIAAEVVSGNSGGYSKRDRRIDSIVTHPVLSVPLMLLFLTGIFWLTIVGSNFPSSALQSLFDRLEAFLWNASAILPTALREALISGILRTLFRVIAVMLPPMAIFFPLFTLLEDLGLLGRIAFNLDGLFSRAHTCGKQALTMCMGLGCNAAGVVGCRIIDSPRERLIAVLTNNFMPCNGRFPILITMSTLLFAGRYSGAASAFVMTASIVIGGAVTLSVSRFLSRTVLRGKASSFTLELPSYRRPQFLSVLVRSIFERTLFVLARAAAVAAPAGLIIWICANVNIGGLSILSYISGFLDPFGQLIGLDGVVLCAFILGFPANEIVLPLILMCYTASGSLGSADGIASLLAANGWTAVSYINMMILTVFHFPCSTTVLTIRKETGSIGYTALAVVLPTVIGLALCAAVKCMTVLL